MPQKCLQNQKLCEFILNSKFPTWDSKSKIAEKIDDCVVFSVEDQYEIEGIALLTPLSEKEFHCELVIAKSKKVFKQLVTQFKQEFPNAVIKTAHRRMKLIQYSNSDKLLSKILSLS